MNGPKRDIQADLDALAAGELDALSPQQIEHLEACLNSRPEAAERLAGRTPPIEPLFRISAESPSEEVWERLWQRVDAAGTPARGGTGGQATSGTRYPTSTGGQATSGTRYPTSTGGQATSGTRYPTSTGGQATSGTRRLLQLWQPMLAAAAVVLLIGFWDLARPPAQPDWPVEWAREVEINEFEVLEGAAPFVLVGGMDDPISVIWVFDAEG